MGRGTGAGLGPHWEQPLLSWDTGVCMQVTFTEEVPSSWSPGPPHQAERAVPNCFPPSLGPTHWVEADTPHSLFFVRWGESEGCFCSAAASATPYAPCSLVSRAGGTPAPEEVPGPSPTSVVESRGWAMGGPAGPAHPPLTLLGWGLPRGCLHDTV